MFLLAITTIGLVVYGLHSGTLPLFTNLPDAQGRTLSQRLGAFLMTEWFLTGYAKMNGHQYFKICGWTVFSNEETEKSHVLISVCRL